MSKQRGRATVSIHAPAGGATHCCFQAHFTELFQSTLPQGERLLLKLTGIMTLPVSIHAPAGGATWIGSLY